MGASSGEKPRLTNTHHLARTEGVPGSFSEMGVLPKYLCKEFFKLLILCQLIFVSIYLIVHFFSRFDNFTEAHVSISRMLPYLLYKSPYIIVQMFPPATLIAVIIMFTLMKKHNEILALKASGMNLWRLSQPVLLASLFVAIGLFFFSEIIVPYTSSKSNEIWRTEVERQDPGRFYGRDHIWYKGSHCIYWIRNFDNKKMVMRDPTFYFFDPSFHLVKKIDARLGIWKNGEWEVRQGVTMEAQDDGDYVVHKFKRINLKLPETPETFVRQRKKPEEMGYWQLKRFAKRLRMEGYDATRYLVDMNIKLAFPLINFIMVLIGIPIALGLRKGGSPLAVSLGISACFLYLVNLGVARSLGLSGILPPILSAWLANGVFFFLGIYLMIRVEG